MRSVRVPVTRKSISGATLGTGMGVGSVSRTVRPNSVIRLEGMLGVACTSIANTRIPPGPLIIASLAMFLASMLAGERVNGSFAVRYAVLNALNNVVNEV